MRISDWSSDVCSSDLRRPKHMFMRTFSVAALTLVLSACGSPGEQEEMADIDGKLYCAVDGANELTQSCTLERIEGPDGNGLVLHHHGGGFRRFRIVLDGRGVIPDVGARSEERRVGA